MPVYQRFIFESYELDRKSRRILLHYSLDDKLQFTETVTLPSDLTITTDHPNLQSAMFALHLAGGVSYFKTYCPPQIEVRSGQLSPHQADFWNSLYTHGLGEFFYTNKIDFRGLINFPTTVDEPKYHAEPPAQTPKRMLVPFGGGKDSLVTVELVRATGVEETLFRLRGHHLVTDLADATGLPLVVTDRQLDEKLFELNRNGAYNGHVPITAYISFLSIVVGLLCGFDAVAFSSERSSSFGSVDYLGMEVNHQWSKSLAAEELMRDYIARFITGSVSYLNPIRPLSELHIAKLFAKYPKYFPLATSCNRNWLLSDHEPHANHWCGVCPKCAFTFALLAAWLPEPTLTKIFGHNLYTNMSLRPLYRQLWGLEGFKPFECVGTPEETQAAFYLARTKDGFKNTALMTEFTREALPKMLNPDQLVHGLLTPQFETVSDQAAEILKKAGIK